MPLTTSIADFGNISSIRAYHWSVASQTLVNAARILSSVPAAMQLRYLQTLTEIGAEQNSTVVFPMPIDIIKPFLELIEQPARAIGANGARPSLLPAP